MTLLCFVQGPSLCFITHFALIIDEHDIRARSPPSATQLRAWNTSLRHSTALASWLGSRPSAVCIHCIAIGWFLVLKLMVLRDLDLSFVIHCA